MYSGPLIFQILDTIELRSRKIYAYDNYHNYLFKLLTLCILKSDQICVASKKCSNGIPDANPNETTTLGAVLHWVYTVWSYIYMSGQIFWVKTVWQLPKQKSYTRIKNLYIKLWNPGRDVCFFFFNSFKQIITNGNKNDKFIPTTCEEI